jgi:hypothetical protein
MMYNLMFYSIYSLYNDIMTKSIQLTYALPHIVMFVKIALSIHSLNTFQQYNILLLTIATIFLQTSGEVIPPIYLKFCIL